MAVRSELQQVTITRSLCFYTAVLFCCCSATHTAFSPPQAVHIMVGLLNIGLGASLTIFSSPYPFWLGGMVISSFCPGHFYLKYAHLFTLYSIEIHPKIYINTWPPLECLIMNAIKLIELWSRSLCSIFICTQSVFCRFLSSS